MYWGILRLFKHKTEGQTMAELQCHAMRNKNRNHSINEVKKLGYERWLIFTVIGNILLQQLWMNLCNKQWLLCSFMSSKKISIIQQLNQETGIWKILFLYKQPHQDSCVIQKCSIQDAMLVQVTETCRALTHCASSRVRTV